MTAPQGWYSSTDGQPYERWWDGYQWTEHTRPLTPAAPPPRPSPRPQPAPSVGHHAPAAPPSHFNTGTPPPARPLYRRGWFIAVAGIVGLVIVLGVISAAVDGGSSTNASSPASTASTVRAAPPPASGSTSRRPASSSRHSRSTRSHKRTAAGSRDGSFTMPNEIGQNLQAAQDDVQRVSGDPIFVTHSRDLRGDRFQFFDRDWQVCSQNVSAGSHASAVEHIVFGVVKTDESCP